MYTKRIDDHPSAGQELDKINATERGRELVLLPTGKARSTRSI